MTQLDPYLIFDGNCAEAMRFYQKTLGGKLDLMTNAQAPEGPGPQPGREDKILHARLSLDGGGVIMASDTPPDYTYQGMHEFSLALGFPSNDEAKRIFDALAEGGKVTMPMGKTFWAEAFGMLVDRFGTPWFVSGAPVPM